VKLRLTLAALLALALPAAASADVKVRQPDTRDYPTVSVSVVTAKPTRRAPALAENGRRVHEAEASNLGRAKSVVIAIDNSRSMEGKALADALAAARQFVRAKAPGDRISVVTFGSHVDQVTRFSAATIDTDIALRSIEVDPRQGTALHDALALAARVLSSEALPARVVVLLTDGDDTLSKLSADAAAALARRKGVSVYPIGIEGEGFDPVTMRRIAGTTGGSYRGVSSSEELRSAYAAITAEFRRTWRFSYITAARPGEKVSLASWTPGTAKSSLDLTLPGKLETSPVTGSAVPDRAFQSPASSLVVGLVSGFLLLLSIALIAAARKEQRLKARIAAHVAGGKSKAKAEAARERFAAGSALMRATENAFGHLRFWHKVHRLLERADLPLRTVEFLYITLGSSFLVGFLGAASGQSSFFILGGFAVGAAAPFGYVTFKAKRRLRAFDNQLPDILLTAAASLKAGHSFRQSLQTVADEGQPPASKEFQRALAEARLGRAMDSALVEMAERVGSKDLDFVITAITIHSQVGGSLAGLFDMVAEAVRQRQQFARKISGLTAMGRASAYVLVGLPFATCLLLTLINRELMDPLYHTSTGHLMIFTGLTMMGIGSLLLKKIVSFKG
jgi:tight adherence protein B